MLIETEIGGYEADRLCKKLSLEEEDMPENTFEKEAVDSSISYVTVTTVCYFDTDLG